jgi:FkbM family methyltransferase
MTLLRKIHWKTRWRFLKSPFVIRSWHHGYRITFPLSGSAAQIYYRRYSEPEVAAWMMRHIRTGDRFVDIGAHVGEYSLIAASAVGPRGAVIAVEPQEDLCGFIERNFRENRIPNSRVIHGALGDHCGRCQLFTDTKTKGAVLNLAADESSIPMFDIPTLLGEEEWNGTVWMKLDAAGFELPCLIAGRDYLRKHKVHLILKAYNSSEVRNRFPEVKSSMPVLLDSMGYRCFVLHGDALQPWSGEVHGYCDTVICLPADARSSI